MAGLVLSDSSYWFLYSGINNPDVIAGLVQGNGTSSDNEFHSSNTRDFNLEVPEIFNDSISANYSQRQTLDGTVADTGGASATFNLAYDVGYEATPALALVAGMYFGDAATADGNDSVTVTIDGVGSLTTVSVGGCQGNGTVTPRSDGNAYDVSVTFLGGVCSNGISTVTGVAFLAADGVTLYSAALNSNRTNGFIFLGAK